MRSQVRFFCHCPKNRWAEDLLAIEDPFHLAPACQYPKIMFKTFLKGAFFLPHFYTSGGGIKGSKIFHCASFNSVKLISQSL